MNIHPSGSLTMDLDADQFNPQVAADLRRSFLSIGPVRVLSHPATQPAANVFVLSVRLSHPYWTSQQPGADELWPDVSAWLGSKEHFVGSAIANFNATRAQAGSQTVDYARMDVEMGPVTLEFSVRDNAMPPVRATAERLRQLMGNGTLDQIPARVRVLAPTDAPAPKDEADEKDPAPAGDADQHEVWEVVDADGNVRLLDATAGAWA